MDNITDVFFNLIKLGLGCEGASVDLQALTEDTLDELYKFSAKYDMVHLVSAGLTKLGITEAQAPKFYEKMFDIMFFVANFDSDLKSIKSKLNGAGVDFVPLKGSVLRDYYPERWMRSSCDIDILIKSEDIERVNSIFVDNLKYAFVNKGGNEMEYRSLKENSIEMHFSLSGMSDTPSIKKHLDKAWDYTVLAEQPNEYALTDDMFVFYHVAHMAKHFRLGGCGVRPFVDLWLLHKKLDLQNPSKELKGMLSSSGLDDFFYAAVDTALVWMENKEHSELTKTVESFIFGGNMYNDRSNEIIVKSGKLGKLKTWLGYIFIDSEYLRRGNPLLKKHPVLLPYYEVKRWFLIFSPESRKKMRKTLNSVGSTDSKTAESYRKMFKKFGL